MRADKGWLAWSRTCLLIGLAVAGSLGAQHAAAEQDDEADAVFTASRQTPLADGSVCVAGGETIDGVDGRAVLLMKRGGTVRQRVKLPLPDPDYSDASAVGCLQLGSVWYAVEELDTSSFVSDKRVLLFVDRIERGRLVKRVMLPVRYAGQNFGVARVERGKAGFALDAAGRLVVSGKVYPDALGGSKGKPFAVRLTPDLAVLK
ncbi:hypothetical protein [Chromobacterium sp. CV08]|uniref:hypothetical protein n=1 Tax=Chromobacterium sp. CV08 TaxID=3133274 RepID=UPI003DA8D110